jgi:hypothetical protein
MKDWARNVVLLYMCKMYVYVCVCVYVVCLCVCMWYVCVCVCVRACGRASAPVCLSSEYKFGEDFLISVSNYSKYVILLITEHIVLLYSDNVLMRSLASDF